MGSEKGQKAEQASINLSDLSAQYGTIATRGLEQRGSIFNAMLGNNGMPEYLNQAFQAQRAGIQEAGANQQLQGYAQQQGQAKVVGGAGGNLSAGLSPFDLGSQIANATTSSRTQQLMAGIENVNNVTSGMFGSAATTGNAAMQAAGNQLQSIGQLPGYNKNAALAASLGSAAFSAYGGLSQYNAGRDRTGGYAASPGQPGHGYQPGIGVQAPGNVSTSLYGTNYYSALNPWNVAGGGR